MLLYPLIIGVLSMLSPFMGLILLFVFMARTIGISLVKPIQAIMMFFAVPAIMLVIDTDISTRVMALDAIAGVGLTTGVFLSVLKRNHVLSEAFMVSFIVLAGYGLVRASLFGDYHNQLFEQGMLAIKEQMPQMMDNAMMERTMPLWKTVMPAVWILSQGLALLIGFAIFQKLLHIPDTLQNMRFPGMYNLLIISIIPLYLIQSTQMLFVNALIALCMIPLLQGIAVLWQRMKLIFSNQIVLSILMIIITIYANVLLVLIGFADMWLSKQNSIPGGTPA